MAAEDPVQGTLFGDRGRLVQRTRRDTDRTIAELRKLRRLEPVQVGLVAMLRTLADLIDAEVRSPERSAWVIARLASEWRAVHAELRGEASAGWDAQLAAFFTDHDEEGARGGTAVRDTPGL